MSRHGRCRCGTILKFHRGPNGYKTRCPGCGSVVRLRVGSGQGKDQEKVRCRCGARVEAGSTGTCPACGRPLTEAPFAEALHEATARTETLSVYEPSNAAAPACPAPPAEVVSAAASALPSEILTSSELTPNVPCAECGALIPPHRRYCPTCETRKILISSLDVGIEVEPLPEEKARRTKWRVPPAVLAWLAVVAVLGAICLAALLLFL